MTDGGFLADRSLRRVDVPRDWPWKLEGLGIGPGNQGLEVLVATADARPRASVLREEWKRRRARRAAPVLLAVVYGDKAALCGPAGEEPPTYLDLDREQAERICREALREPDRHAAIRFLREVLPSLGEDLPGLRNRGLLATYQLREGARDLPEWQAAAVSARSAVGQEGESLLRALEFEIERADNVTSFLRVRGKKRVAAVLLDVRDAPERESARFSGLSPVAYAIRKAEEENVPWVLLVQGPKIRLYPARIGVGVASRGLTETYIELHTSVVPEDRLAFLWLLFSADALAEGGTVERLLAESMRYAALLAEELRDRIYQKVVPRLAEGLAEARQLAKPNAVELAETYEAVMTLLFRLLFVAYAEDKDLLPYRWNEHYRRRSLTSKAEELMELHRSGAEFDEGDSLWQEIRGVFHAVAHGHREWGVPAYDGGLFAADPAISRTGELLEQVRLGNRVFGPALRDLLLEETPEGLGQVDFRSLGVREFGTIYEGLLESELAVAETDLTVDAKGQYRPASVDDDVVVSTGRVYLHDRSGSRKATGTYFTKPFAVEHLLDLALEPALEEHLARLDALDADEAALNLFDFRVVDLAMGSGHFLVAAVDRIERALSGYLARRELPLVRGELATLRTSAENALGDLSDHVPLEDGQLLRRLIARRCIYGVDLNPMAVQLGRLALWIHTFVPGLPLSLLDHNLRAGNSLTGIGRLSEIEEKAKQDDLPLFSFKAADLIGGAMEPLRKLGRIADLNAADVEKARRMMEEARQAVEPAAALCDVTAAARLEGRRLPIAEDRWSELRETLVESSEVYNARALLDPLQPFHFPVEFPEVFLRERAGFDVILGNPPWKEATLEEHAFWARHFPGLRGLSPREQEAEKARLRRERPDLVRIFQEELAHAGRTRQALVRGPFAGMGTGDPDLYKAFCWRFWQLGAHEGAHVGVVLPRSVWNAKGSSFFRREVFEHSALVDLTFLENRSGWVFDDAEHRYTTSLVGITRGRPLGESIRLRGPYASAARLAAGKGRVACYSAEEVESWTDTAALPLLPTEESLEIFAGLRQHPRLDLDQAGEWRVRPYRELDATNDKKHMDMESKACPEGFWPVYKGESFDIWNPETGTVYGWADPAVVLPVLQAKRERSGRSKRGVFEEFEREWLEDPETLPCLGPRIAFRDISRATDSRTVRVALIPACVFLANQAPTFLRPRGDEHDEAYLLGLVSSIPLDWYARRFVETHLNYHVLNPFPIPRPVPEDPLRRRVVELAGRLAARDERYAEWADAVGVEWGPLDEDEMDDRIAELDAVVARLYGLTEPQLVHVFETFHEGWDYRERIERVLSHYRGWPRGGA